MRNDDNHEWDVQEDDAPPEVEAFFTTLNGRWWPDGSLGCGLKNMMHSLQEAHEEQGMPVEACQMALVSVAFQWSMQHEQEPPRSYMDALRILRDAMRSGE